jgi:WhiB family redox-sensing transcriptional regulator
MTTLDRRFRRHVRARGASATRVDMRSYLRRGRRARSLTCMFSERPRWQLHAACRGLDPERFFPERGDSLAPARSVCATCPVRVPCGEYGAGEKVGIWGGLSERERRQRRRRAAQGAAA